MPNLLRLVALPTDAPGEVRFQVIFAAHAAETFPDCVESVLHVGDGHTYAVGQLCAPTAVTWRRQRVTPLPTHRYAGPGPYTARLQWGPVDLQTVVAPAEPAPAAATLRLPTATLFAVAPAPDDPFQQQINVRVEGLAADHTVRLDGGTGQVYSVATGEGEETQAFTFAYAKPGRYLISLELLDDEGFWLATLAETPIEISLAEEPAEQAPAAVRPPTTAEASAVESAPWLPYRNIRPMRSVYTYASPGGGAVRRAVNAGYFLTARAEAVVDGQRWFQTAAGDWVAANAVTFFTPSALQGVVLDATVPPPTPPPPPPSNARRGIVTADVLNVRSAPGVATGNPPIATLRAGAEVTIYEEQPVAGATWYRIGDNRWVHGGYVRIVAEPAPTPPSPPTPPPSDARRGIVTANVLNVRAAPGVAASNPPIATLRAGTEVTIHEDRPVAGATWYRIGANRWVHGGYVRLLDASPHTATVAAEPSAAQLPLGWVVATTLNIHSRPDVATSNPPIGQLSHYDRVAILEQQAVAGIRWFRIGDAQWVEGRQIAVARIKPRPASISANARWVGVSLSEQTLVAYEGDQPVFAALVASGLPGTPTVQGVFATWRRLDTGKMAGPGYYIEDVTWTCYFYSGYALHTAYWHDLFGAPRSHGCVNLSPHDAWWIYQWSAAEGPNSPLVYTYWA